MTSTKTGLSSPRVDRPTRRVRTNMVRCALARTNTVRLSEVDEDLMKDRIVSKRRLQTLSNVLGAYAVSGADVEGKVQLDIDPPTIHDRTPAET